VDLTGELSGFLYWELKLMLFVIPYYGSVSSCTYNQPHRLSRMYGYVQERGGRRADSSDSTMSIRNPDEVAENISNGVVRCRFLLPL
jgi:hypothetical protein